MNFKKRALTFLLDLILLSSIISILVISRKKLEYYMASLQEFSPQLTQLATTLAQQNLSTYDITTTEQIISQTNSLIFNATFFLILIPLTIIIFYLITQSINWKLINKTKIKNFIKISIPFLIITLFFLNSLLNLLSTVLYEFSYNIIWTIFLFLLFVMITYTTLIYYTKQKLKHPLNFIKKSLKKLVLPYSLILINLFFILVNSILIYIFLLVEQSILILLPSLIILLIIFNFQRTSFIKKVNSI